MGRAGQDLGKLDLQLASELVLAGVEKISAWLKQHDSVQIVSPSLSDHLWHRRNYVAFWVSLQEDYFKSEKLKKSSLTFQELCDKLFDSLKSRESLTLSRWGDGEGMALPVLMSELLGWVIPNESALPGSFEYQDPLRQVCDWAWMEIWFGKKFLDETAEDREVLAAGIQRCISESSLLAYYRPEPLGELSRNSPFRRSLGAAMLRPVIEAIRPAIEQPLNPRIHIQLHQEGVLAKLLNESKNVLIVTSKKDVASRIAEDFNASVDLMLIPSEQGRQLKMNGTGAAKSEVGFLARWKEDTQTLINSRGDWDLVLVGGGLVGKAIVGELQTLPCVVLDVGAVLDDMAGFKTRSWMKTKL
jgi:hypothetical protein